MNQFLRKKSFGTFGEVYVRKVLSRAGIINELNEAKSKGELIKWDIKALLNGSHVTIEAKFDMAEASTGNIAIEYYNTKQGKPSGIKATTADLWCVVLQNPLTAWVSRTADLRAFFDGVKCFKEVACGGDQNSAMKLWPKDEILGACFHQFDDLEPAAVQQLLTNLLGKKV